MPTTGEVFGSAAASVAEAPWSDNAWSTPTNVFADDAATANVTQATFDSPDQTEVLKVSGFDFSSIPDDATIDGVTARINAWFRAGQGTGSLDLCQLLNVSGAKVGTNQCATPVVLTSTTTTVITKGSTSDLWGNALTPAWVKDPDFGIALGILATAANADVDIDYVTLEVQYTPSPHATVTPGTVTAVATVPAPTVIVPSGGPSREFDGADDFVRVGAGNVSGLGTGAYTIATSCLKPNADVGATFWTCDAAAPGTHGLALLELPTEFQMFHEGNVAGFGSAPAPADSLWSLVLVTKAAGTATPRIHIYNYNTATWHHSDATATLPALAAGRDSVQFGGGPGNFYAGRCAAAAAWDGVVLSDVQIETMEAALQAWADLAPDAGWKLNQASIATPVEDFTGGGADQTAITGTTVASNGPVPFDFSVEYGATAAPTTVAAVATVPTASVGGNVVAQPTTVAAVATVGAPVVSTPITGGAGLQLRGGSGMTLRSGETLRGGTGAVSPDATITPGTVIALATVPSATVSGAAAVTATTVAATGTVGTATPAAGSAAVPVRVAAVATVGAPAVSAGARLAPATVAGTATVGAPAVSAGARPTPAVVAATATVPPPAVSAGGTATITPAAVSAVATVPAATLSVGSRLAPSTVAATAAVPAPTARAGATITPVRVAATASVAAPTVSAGAGATVTPVRVAATASVPSVTVRGSVLIAPATVTAIAAIGAPTLTIGVSLFASTATATATIGAAVIPPTSPPDPFPYRFEFIEPRPPQFTERPPPTYTEPRRHAAHREGHP